MHVRSSMFLALAALMAGPGAQAVGFGRAPSSTLLGSPLNFAVPVRLDSGESISPECVAADVQVGERRLQPGDARVLVEPGAAPDERIVRVLTGSAIDEPLVAVTVTVGCGARITRRFTAFADPPASAIAPPVVAETAAPAAVTGVPALGGPRPSDVPRAVSVDRSSTGAAVRRATRPAPRVAAAVAPDAPMRPAKPARPQRQAAAAPVKAPATGDAVAPLRPAVVAPEVAGAAPLGAARLRLEAADPESFPPRSADAASRSWTPIFSDNPIAVELSASAAERMRGLEQSIELLRAESKANRELMQQMRGRLAEAETTRRMTPWLGGGLAALALLALWLGWRLKRSQDEAQAQWWAASAAEASVSPNAVAPDVAPGATAAPAPSSALPVEPPAVAPKPVAEPAPPAPGMPTAVARLNETRPAESAAAASGARVLDPETLPGDRAPRDVAIDELIDLEQQADFFVVLGQDDAAIDLLVGHNRSSGGTSPMPYMKLLEIYKRKGDRASFDRTRERFNHRFNAVAPAWDEDIQGGRSLEAFPQELQRVTEAWHRPLDALAELEAMLFGRESGQPFDLPAYRELLFLYSLAREHMDDATGQPSAVDLLLPLGDGDAGGGDQHAPVQRVELNSASEFASLDLDLATMPAPVDLALAGEPPAARLVDGDLELRLDDPVPAPPAPSRRG